MKSGNVCAFPNCFHPIINSDGVYVAELCHIEAAQEGGQRFNAKQSNEDRRKFENLLLMCHRHHKETDDEEKYTVEKLKQIKRNHEAKFEQILDLLANDVYDKALSYEPTIPSNLNALIKHGIVEQDEIAIFYTELEQLINLLHKVSPITRKIFLLLLERADSHTWSFSLNEFQYIVSIDPMEAYRHINILERYGLLHDDENTDELTRSLKINCLTDDSPYPIALLIRDYCLSIDLDISSVIVDLNFKQLE